MEPAVIVSIVVAIVGIATFIFNIILSYSNSGVRRAQFFKEIIHEMRFNPDLIEAMTILDYHGVWYDDKFPQSETEVKIDKLLSYLSYVCYLYNNKVISNKEFELMEYSIKSACQNKSTQYYLKFVNRFAKYKKVKHTYNDLINYMKVNVFLNDAKLIDEFENGTKFVLDRDYRELKIKKEDK